jgi:hypothetical protein
LQEAPEILLSRPFFDVQGEPAARDSGYGIGVPATQGQEGLYTGNS